MISVLVLGNILDKVSVLRINLHIDGSPIESKSHTHPSHSQTSRLLSCGHTLPVPPFLDHTCIQVVRQVDRFSEPYLTDIDQLRETDVSKCV
jgi:hypothetical protein